MLIDFLMVNTSRNTWLSSLLQKNLLCGAPFWSRCFSSSLSDPPQNQDSPASWWRHRQVATWQTLRARAAKVAKTSPSWPGTGFHACVWQAHLDLKQDFTLVFDKPIFTWKRISWFHACVWQAGSSQGRVQRTHFKAYKYWPRNNFFVKTCA